MAYLNQRLVAPGSLTKVYDSAEFKVGEVVFDENGNAYLFGKGVASCAEGSWVSLDEEAQATLLVSGAKGRVGVAMGAIASGKYGFFQVFGKTTTAKALTGVVDDANLYATATAGSIDDDGTVTTDHVKGVLARSAESSGVITAELNFPIIDQI